MLLDERSLSGKKAPTPQHSRSALTWTAPEARHRKAQDGSPGVAKKRKPSP